MSGTYANEDEQLFQDPVKVLKSLSEYRDIPKGSPVLFFSPNCGHCVRFSSTYSDWSNRMKKAAPNYQEYAVDLSEVDPVEANIHNRLFPGDQLPQYVPVMSIYGGIGSRIDWGKDDGQKTPQTLAVFFLNNSGGVPQDVMKNIVEEFSLSQNDNGGGLAGGASKQTARSVRSVSRVRRGRVRRSTRSKSPKRSTRSSRSRKSSRRSKLKSRSKSVHFR